MANVKAIEIKGLMAFDVNGEGEIDKLIGWISRPSIGFQVHWLGHGYRDNSWGGKTSVYHYEITGQEAVGDGAIRDMVKTLAKGGRVLSAKYKDIEAENRWVHIPVSPNFVQRDALRELCEVVAPINKKAGENHD